MVHMPSLETWEWGLKIFCSALTLTTHVYDKRDNFDFKRVNFLFLNSNIPANPAYGVYTYVTVG